MRLTLTKVYRNNKDKNGNLLKTRDGRDYTRLSIKAQEYGDKWISGFAGGWNMDWKEGDTVEAEVKQNGEYLNLERLDPMKAIQKAIDDLTMRVSNLEAKAILPSSGTLTAVTDYNQQEDINPEDIPF